jgi:GTPase SAR1 family protein
MVGPRGVGKTSLLAAMYGELKTELKKAGCSFMMEAGPTNRAINERLRELKRVASGSGVKIQTGEGIDATAQEETFTFHLDVGDGGEPEATLEFIDLPGGWYTATGDYQRADEVLANSHVSFLAVDATALMESPTKVNQDLGKYHDDINAPDYIQNAYERVKLKDTHTVVLTLIRAETYIKKGKLPALIRKTQQAYSGLAEILNRNGVHLIGCYVETVGSLYFNAFNEKEGVVSSEFVRDPKKGYSPCRCAVPLRIAALASLRAALDSAYMDLLKEDTFFAKILEIFGLGEALRKAREKYHRVYEAFDSLAQGINEDDYFEIKP